MPNKPWTEAHQREHIARLLAHAAELREAIDLDIAKLLALTQEFDPLDFLAKLSANQLFGNPQVEEKEKEERSESQVEYLQSLILARLYPQTPKWPGPGVVQECFDLVKSTSLMRATSLSSIQRR